MPEQPPFLSTLRSRLTGLMGSALGHVVSFVVGMAAAAVIFYVLYRIGLPSKPFIYVSF
jgi:hypothetical protein